MIRAALSPMRTVFSPKSCRREGIRLAISNNGPRISVDHADFVANYRAAHAQSVKHSRGESSTEDMRQAMVHYRWLFTDLVAEDQRSEVKTAPA